LVLTTPIPRTRTYSLLLIWVQASAKRPWTVALGIEAQALSKTTKAIVVFIWTSLSPDFPHAQGAERQENS
jgi:hypothetical protein